MPPVVHRTRRRAYILFSRQQRAALRWSAVPVKNELPRCQDFRIFFVIIAINVHRRAGLVSSLPLRVLYATRAAFYRLDSSTVNYFSMLCFTVKYIRTSKYTVVLVCIVVHNMPAVRLCQSILMIILRIVYLVVSYKYVLQKGGGISPTAAVCSPQTVTELARTWRGMMHTEGWH